MKDYSAIDGLRKQINECLLAAFEKGYQQGQQSSEDIDRQLENAREDGREEAWKCARKLLLSSDSDGGLECYIIEELFDTNEYYVLRDFPASEAIAKIKEYEEKQNEIKVGDEINHDGLRGIVVSISDESIYTVSAVGTTPKYSKNTKNLKRTGRCFPELAEILRRLKEKE